MVLTHLKKTSRNRNCTLSKNRNIALVLRTTVMEMKLLCGSLEESVHEEPSGDQLIHWRNKNPVYYNRVRWSHNKTKKDYRKKTEKM